MGIVIIVVVHNGTFHADDVILCALIRIEFPGAKIIIIRSRDAKDFEEANIVGDVGLKYDGIKFFDHHQEDTPVYDNSIKYAACGLYLKHMKSLTEFEKNYLLDKALYGVQAQDNGMNVDEKLYPHPFKFVSWMNCDWKQGVNCEMQNKQFMKCVDMCEIILRRIITSAKLSKEATDRVSKAFSERKNHVMNLGEYCPWSQQVVESNMLVDDKVMAVIFKNSEGGYNVQTVPRMIGSFTAWKNIPKEVETYPGCTFRHKSGFLAKFNNKAMAEIAAKKTVES